MLQTLIIDSLTLIDHAELDFDGGLIGFTGETGAGKSLLLGAIRLLAGSRTDRVQVRDNCEQCRIEGSLFFKNPDEINQFLQEHDLPLCESGNLLLRRVIGSKSKAFVNGVLVPLQVLKRLGALWLEFHDPTEPQRLFQSDYQLSLLDGYLTNNKEPFLAAYQQLKSAEKIFNQLKSQTVLTEDQITFKRHQLQLLESIDLSNEAVEALTNDFEKLSHREQCLELFKCIDDSFNSENVGLLSHWSTLQNAMNSLSQHWQPAVEMAQRLESLLTELQDIESSCMQGVRSFELDETQMQEIQNRMQLLMELKRQYGPSIENLRQERDSIKAQLDLVLNGQERLVEAERQLNVCQEHAILLAKELHAKRLQIAEKLKALVVEKLKLLGFQNPVFDMQWTELEHVNESGLYRLQFLFSSDVNLAPRPLDKVASSGELSRILLALKTVLKEEKSTAVLVFDEIDANVGGEVGSRVGQLLRKMGESSQIFCVTHLTQVAACVQEHFSVRKHVASNGPSIEFVKLNTQQARIEEIARMLGDAQSPSALSHAKALLALEK